MFNAQHLKSGKSKNPEYRNFLSAIGHQPAIIASLREIKETLENSLTLKGLDDLRHRHGAFEAADKRTLAVVKSEVGEAAHIIKGRHEEINVFAHHHVRQLFQLVALHEFVHLVNRVQRRHDDMYVLQRFLVLEQLFRRMLAMAAFGTAYTVPPSFWAGLPWCISSCCRPAAAAAAAGWDSVGRPAAPSPVQTNKYS
jgi:hypothetical protein